jgi:hypothetical protein
MNHHLHHMRMESCKVLLLISFLLSSIVCATSSWTINPDYVNFLFSDDERLTIAVQHAMRCSSPAHGHEHASSGPTSGHAIQGALTGSSQMSPSGPSPRQHDAACSHNGSACARGVSSARLQSTLSTSERSTTQQSAPSLRPHSELAFLHEHTKQRVEGLLDDTLRIAKQVKIPPKLPKSLLTYLEPEAIRKVAPPGSYSEVSMVCCFTIGFK